MKKNIYGIKRSDLEEYFLKMGEKKFKALQVYEWLYQKRVDSFYKYKNPQIYFHLHLTASTTVSPQASE